MKRAIAIILAVLCIFALVVLLTGCGHADVDALDGHGKRFQVIEFHPSLTEPYAILVDMETGVEYVRFYNSGSVLVDSYGNPILYPAFDAREDRP